MFAMANAVVADRRATRDEVLAHADAIRRIAAALALGAPGIRQDGTVVVHSDEPGYHSVNRVSIETSRLVGAYVHVITDDVPGAGDTAPL